MPLVKNQPNRASNHSWKRSRERAMEVKSGFMFVQVVHDELRSRADRYTALR